MISIIEFVVYGLIAYSGVLVLIVSIITKNTLDKSLAILKVIWLIPSMIAAALLSNLGSNISLNDVMTTENIINGTTGVMLTNSTIVTTNTINFVNFISWTLFHQMIFLVLLTYVIIQLLTLFLFKND